MTDPQPLTRRELREAERAAELAARPELTAENIAAIAQDDAEFAAPELLSADLLARLQPEATIPSPHVPSERIDEQIPVPVFVQTAYADTEPDADPFSAAQSAVPEPLVFSAPAPLSFGVDSTNPAPYSPASFEAPVAQESTPEKPAPVETSADLFRYPAAAVSAPEGFEPILTRAPAATPTPLSKGFTGKKKTSVEKSAPVSKGVNLWSLIAIISAVAAGAFAFVPDFMFAALPIAGTAVVLAVVSFFFKGFNKIQSIVAIALALIAGGYNGYVAFIAPAPSTIAVVVPAPANRVAFSVFGDGAPLVSVAYSGSSSGVPFREIVPVSAPMFTKSVSVKKSDAANPQLFTMTVTPSAGAKFVSCEIRLNGVQIASAAAKLPTSPLTCTGKAATASKATPAVTP